MKKNLLLGACAILAGIGTTQAQQATTISPDHMFRTDEVSSPFTSSANRVTSYTDTVWFDGFENPATWNMTMNNPSSDGWVISNAAGTNQGSWYFQNTRINSTTGGNYAVIVPDNPTTGTPVMTDAKLQINSAIDISAYTGQNLVLHYEYYAARFYDTLKAEVSGDGVNWTTLEKHDDLGLLSTGGGSVSVNPGSKEVFIPSSVVASDSLYIRFFWDASGPQPGIGYGWFIDDIMVLDVLEHDLVIDQSAWFDPVRILYSWYFGAMPSTQAAADSMFLSATHTNFGKQNETGVQLTMDVQGPSNSSYSSAVVSTAAGASGDTLTTEAGGYFMPTIPGSYNVSWVISADSVDNNPANNTRTVEFDVTNDIYSMAPYPISKANVIGKSGPLGTTANGGAYTLTQDYFFMANDSIKEIGIAFDSEWSEAVSAFQLSLLDGNGTPVAQSAITPVAANMITDDIVWFPMQTPAAVPAGFYEAQLEYFGGSGDSLFIVVCQDPAAPNEPAAGGGFFSRTTISYGGNNFIDDMAYIVLRTGNNCAPLNLAAANVNPADCGVNNGGATVQLSGASCPTCFFNWGDQSGTGLETRTDLGAGTYNVTVSDPNGCSDEVAVVIPNANAPEVDAVAPSDETCFGDADGSITLTMGASGTAPFTYDWSNGAQTSAPTVTGLAPGTYDVTITDASSCLTTENGIVVAGPSSALTAAGSPDNNGFGSGEVTASGGTPPYTYLWSTGETTSSISGSDGGNLTVTVTDANGCTVDETMTITPVGTNDIEFASSLSIFPNPNNGSFNISFADLSGTYTVSIVSTIGQVIDTRIVPVTGTHVETLDNIELTNGIYFVSVKSEEGSEATIRVVVK